MSEERLTEHPGESDEFEPLLGALRPQPSGVSRDRLMFLAGHRTARQQRGSQKRWLWPLATVASWVMTAAVLGAWTTQTTEVVPKEVAVETPQVPTVSPVAPTKDDQVVATTDADTTSPAQDSFSDSTFAVEADADVDRLLSDARLSMRIGWQGDRSADRLANNSEPASHPTNKTSARDTQAVPATYSRLREQYRNNPMGAGFGGDRL